MKQNWEIKKLGEVAKFQRGLTYSKKDEVDISENIVLRATNINLEDSKLDLSELKYINENIKIKDEKVIKKNALLICLSSGSKKHLGKVALVDDDYGYAFGGFIGQIIPNKSTYPKYLFYALISDTYKKYIFELSDGANINNLKSKDLQAFQIPLPPLPEQQRIVAILDKAFAEIAKAKANAEQNLKNAKELFESYLNGMFENKGEGWEEKTLNDVCEELFAGGDVPKNNSSKFETKIFNIPIFSNGEKNKGLYGYTNIVRVAKPSITISARGTIGYSEIRKEAFYPAIRLIVVTPKIDIVDLTYLKYVISEINFKYSGSSIPQLTVPMIKGYPISYPSLKQQKFIVQKLDALSAETKKLEAIYQKKIVNLQELKKSVLQKAFRGEL